MSFQVCVLGLGYVGLPTASILAVSGQRVLGVDVDPARVAALREGRLHLQEPDLNTLVEAAVRSGNLEIRERPAPADAFIIAVPTPLGPGRRANLDQVLAAARTVAPLLRSGNLVVLESTVPPGTTRDLLAPLLESSGLRAGEDFHLAHCPERVLPGAILLELVQDERTIGGLTPACADRAAELYRGFVKGQLHLTDCTTAEMVKVMENTYRDVNIALANEFALIAERIGVDVWEAIRLANRHPRVQVLRPGPGVGGHCIAVDPWFLVQAAPEEAALIRESRRINDAMPARVVRLLLREAPPQNGPIALFGAAYKGDTDDVRESPGLAVLGLALEAGYEAWVYDPHVKTLPCHASRLRSLAEAVRGVQAIVVLSDHSAFRRLDVGEIAPAVGRRLVIDTRDCLEQRAWREHDFRVLRLGDGRARRVEAVPT